MSDSDALDMDDGESPEGGSAPKKKKNALGALLPTILKFAAIGIGALVFIVTVTVITYNVMNGGGKTQTNVSDPNSPYYARKPIFAWYTDIGQITTRTRDEKNYSVQITMNLGYDQTDTVAYSELSGRKFELQEFVRRYFAGKSVVDGDLNPENEERLKQEIKEQLNNRYLETARVRDITFTKLDVMEAF